ncbi:hypothetical protein X777_13262 [Ooceraea biroi]|uniref:Uncharacterized protein n=1 Tax=Ooceraea biroi TaxID=2015173 RepID=A0A026VYV9_OOCBI|nr:hypothetical protein X777_13262 [Ooceraea biroi]
MAFRVMIQLFGEFDFWRSTNGGGTTNPSVIYRFVKEYWKALGAGDLIDL